MNEIALCVHADGVSNVVIAPAELEILKTFFGGYFHEDWRCGAKRPEEVVEGYRRDAKPDEIRALRQAIQAYARALSTDDELDEKLFSELGCYYSPKLAGVSAKAWLHGIAQQLWPDPSPEKPA